MGVNMFRKLTIAFIGTAALTAAVTAAEMPSSSKLATKIDEIKMRYQPRIDALRRAGEDATKNMPSKEEMMLKTSIIKMRRVEWYVKIPEFSLRQQTWYVRIPEFKMGLQRIVWHMPEPCAKYMRFPWGGGMHVPGICMREKDWRFHVPEVAMREQKWILGIPEVTMKEHHWIFDLPEIHIESSKKRVDEAKAKAEVLERQGQQVADDMSREIKTAVRDYLTEARPAVAAQFDQGLASLRAALATAPDQAKADLRKKLAELEKARAEAIQSIDDQLAAIS
jgi:hypothetical protein